ncbi:MAG: RsbRD N-terminal domain-containing protein [Deltaproteobacteria bacterium]|nr:RsbRD N-terminal domain-containing protein [Deltaproteobacteria bacterium]
MRPEGRTPVILKDLLVKNRDAILERWLHLILETYPADTSTLLKQSKDRFLNPVGYTIFKEIEALFDELLEAMNFERLSSSLNNILKIRSVQDFSPSQAIGFTLLLKKAVEEVFGRETQKEQTLEEWLRFYSRIDQMAIKAFDIYMDCREKICEIRVNQARAEREMAFKMMERMNVLKEKT